MQTVIQMSPSPKPLAIRRIVRSGQVFFSLLGLCLATLVLGGCSSSEISVEDLEKAAADLEDVVFVASEDTLDATVDLFEGLDEGA